MGRKREKFSPQNHHLYQSTTDRGNKNTPSVFTVVTMTMKRAHHNARGARRKRASGGRFLTRNTKRKMPGPSRRMKERFFLLFFARTQRAHVLVNTHIRTHTARDRKGGEEGELISVNRRCVCFFQKTFPRSCRCDTRWVSPRSSKIFQELN